MTLNMNPKDRILWLLAFIVLALCCVWTAHATPVTGTLKLQGRPFTGYLDVALVYPGSTGTYLNLPGTDSDGHLRIVNGKLPAMDLDGNDTMLPSGTYYQFTYYDAYAAPLARLNYVITGASFDVGAAVPTPVTPANISYQDLNGLRSIITQNLTVSNQFQLGSGLLLQPSGVSNAEFIEATEYAAGYAALGGSSTCGVQEALAALPGTGGTIVLQPGSCTVTAGISVTKPVVFEGLGGGGGPLSNGTLPSPSTLVNASNSPLITVTPITGSTLSLSGVVFRDLALRGGTGSADCVYVRGGAPGAPAVSGVTLEGVFLTGCAGHALHIVDGVTGVHIHDSILTGAGGSDVYIEAPNAGPQGDISLTDSRFDSAAIDGLTLAATSNVRVVIRNSLFTGNTANGVHLMVGATGSAIIASASSFSNNHNAGVDLQDGQGSVINDSLFNVGSFQLYGIYADFPTLTDTSATQLALKDNDLENSLNADIYEGTSTSYLLLYPQKELQGSPNVHYNFLNPAAVHIIAPQSSTSCGANGCYRILADGTIDAWGTVSVPPSGNAYNSASITFPTSFSVAPEVNVNTVGTAGSGDATTPPAVQLQSVSTTGASVYMARVVVASAGGGSFNNTLTLNWHAIGH